jgi:DNA helicase-2/ATP-dependent DNA helicase PcrA
MQHKIDAEIGKFERTRAALLSYPLYQKILTDNGRYDFDDMILWVISAFKQNQALLSDYQERYQYLLVDEYQDTSSSQNEIVSLLMGYWDNPNLFVVGDDDQSIYRFQGASVANILQFNDVFHPALVTLTHNYRSNQQILNAAQALIDINTRRLASKDLLGIDKTLLAVKGSGDPPEIRIFPTSKQESMAIGLELERLHTSGSDLSSSAVLYHNHRQADDLITYLAAAGVPYSTRKRINVLADPGCMQLLSILKYLAAEYVRPHSEEGALFRILHYPLFNHDPLEIAHIYASASRAEKRPAIRHLLRSTVTFSHFSRLIENTLTRIEAVTVQELVHEIITRFGMLADTGNSRETVWRLEMLTTIFDFIKDESTKNPRLSLTQLVSMINSMESQDIPLPAQRIALNSSGVNLITTHSSKGLEFNTVYLMGCTESDWEGQRTRTNFALPPGIGPGTSEKSDDEELRRLFFVAMTRAKNRLFISCPERNNNDKPLAKSRFVAELEQSGSVTVKACQLDEEELAHALSRCFQPPQPDRESVFSSDFVGELLKDYRLSFSHLNQYLECPRTYFYTHILRIPAPKTAATAFGTAVHNSLEFLFRSMKESPARTFPGKDLFLDFFSRQIHKQQDAFTEIEFQRRLASGLTSMAMLYDENINRWHKDVQIEQKFEAVVSENICLNGRVDKLEVLQGRTVNLVDYKTGNYDKKKFQLPNPEKVLKAESEGKTASIEDIYGGTYWRQAVFYKILLENSTTTGFHVSSAEFCFVEPDATSGNIIQQKVEINPKEMDFVRGLIETVHRKIMNREFNQECGRKYCQWCSKA